MYGIVLYPAQLRPSYTAQTVTALARCSAAIARLDARISASPVAKAWRTRAAWSGYTRALELQGVEVDEIDVYSWGCGLRLAGRPLLSTTSAPFADFALWERALAEFRRDSWRDILPNTIGNTAGAECPPLVRALDLVRQYARQSGSALPWLAAPIILSGLGLTAAPLPCLAGGVKAFRLKRTLADNDWTAAFSGLARAAETGLARLEELERLHRLALKAILEEYRPGSLPRLLALCLVRPLLSPQAVASALGLSLAGASKLLDRAASTGLLVDITRRKTWRQFLTADLAIMFGFTAPPRGRPRSIPPALPANPDLARVLESFDREMEDIDRLLRVASRVHGAS